MIGFNARISLLSQLLSTFKTTGLGKVVTVEYVLPLPGIPISSRRICLDEEDTSVLACFGVYIVKCSIAGCMPNKLVNYFIVNLSQRLLDHRHVVYTFCLRHVYGKPLVRDTHL